MRNYRRNIAVRVTTRIIQWKTIESLCLGFFRQITSPNVIASQVKLTELFEILLKVSIRSSFDGSETIFYSSYPIISTTSIRFNSTTFQRACKAVSIMYVTSDRRMIGEFIV